MRNQVKSGIQLTEDQKEAVSSIKDELFNGSGIATLKGFAGTGKTTLLKFIVDEVEDLINEIYLMAPTHKASEVLERRVNREVQTVHSAFGLRPVWDGDGGYDFKKTGEDPIDFIYKSLIAVDEASMVDEKLYDNLLSVKKQYNLKILFVGDPAQLPPVNHENSPSFSHDGYMLTDIIRQADENPILEASMGVREHGSNWDFKPQTSSSGEGVYILDGIEDFFHKSIKNFNSQKYRDTGDYARVLAYKNETVNKYNNLFRDELYSESNQQFVEGEWLIAMEPWTPINSKQDYNPIIQNSEEVVVENRDIVKVDGWFAWELIISSSPSSRDKRRIKVLHEAEKKRYNRKLKKLKEKAKEKSYIWSEYYDLKEKFAKVDYNFALTTHKAQGSTFNRVFMDLCDLKSCYDYDERDSLIYVATTRPSSRLYVLKSY